MMAGEDSKIETKILCKWKDNFRAHRFEQKKSTSSEGHSFTPEIFRLITRFDNLGLD